MSLHNRLNKIEKRFNGEQRGSKFIKLLVIASDKELIQAKIKGIESLLEKYQKCINEPGLQQDEIINANLRIIDLDLVDLFKEKIDMIPISNLIRLVKNKANSN